MIIFQVYDFCTTDLFMELVMKELNITKFNQEADCRDQWDTITEDELQECLDKGVADLQKRRYLQGSNKEIEESD